MDKTLKGLRILNTRPQQQNHRLALQLHAVHAESIYCPLLEITACSNQWLLQLPELATVTSAVFISANAVTYCFDRLADQHISWPAHINVIAIGQGTAKALADYHINVAAIPVAPDSEHLLALPCLQQVAGQSVLLFKGEGGRELIEQSLLDQGAALSILNVYQRGIPPHEPQYINSLWHDDAVDIILLTSEQSIRNLFIMFPEPAHAWLHNKPCLVVSRRLAETAAYAGMKRIMISHPNHMMDALFDYYHGINQWLKQ